MNAVLREVSRQLKYRALAGLIGRGVVVTSMDSAPLEVAVQLQDRLPSGAQLKGPEAKYIRIAVAKYGILDLTCFADGIVWKADDAPGIPLLENLFFVVRDPAPSDGSGLFDDKDPTCLEQLQKGINEQHTLLRLFLEERPKRTLKERLTSSRQLGSDLSDGVDVLDNYFPRTFEVVDACLTNSNFVWFHKHFYF